MRWEAGVYQRDTVDSLRRTPIVLNVDDSDDRRRFRTMVLRESDFAVVEARTGTEALRLAHDQRPSLVLLDVNLPDLSGIEVCRRLKASPATEAIPVLHVTAAFPDDAHCVEGLRGGADSYLAEPVSPEVLIEVIRTLLRRVAAETAARHAQRGAERALRASERRYRALFDHAPYGICQTTPDGRFLAVNHALAHLLGFASREELTAAGDVGQFYADPTERTRLIEAIERGRAIAGAEVAWRRKDGQSITVRVSSRRIHEGFETFIEDVTERQHLEEQRRQSQKLEAIGQLAGGIAHDFNNALTVILGYADMLTAQIGRDKPLGRDLSEIQRSAEHAAALTKQLLAFSRQQPLRLTVVDLNLIVRDDQKLLQRLIGEPIAIQTTVATAPCLVKADAAQLQQILINLAVNGRDAMPDGGFLTIETAPVSIEPTSGVPRLPLQPGPYVRLTVRDTGVGMDATTQGHVFEPFFTTKEAGKGTGLGLATVYGIVQQLGGCIVVESTVNRGTQFDIYLPQTDEILRADSSPCAIDVPAERATVLVVEDEPAVRGLTVSILTRHGYEAVEAAGSLAALQLPDELLGTVDVLLTDVVMPFMSGVALATRLCARRPGLRVLYMSGYVSRHDNTSGDWSDVDVALRKPFTAPQLLDAVHRALTTNRA
jgi:PAS domain S-box-containing protein